MTELRGWTSEAMERLGVVLEGDRAVLPVYDSGGELVGRLRYQPDPDRLNGRSKMLADAGTARDLFPPPETIADDEPFAAMLWLVEGEPDSLRMWSAGLAACGVPGAANWRDEWVPRFSPKWKLAVCFDCDEAGRTNAKRAALAFFEAGYDVRLVDLDPKRDDGYDLSDYLREHDVFALREHALSVAQFSPDDEPGAIVFEPLGVFLERDLPPAESLVGVTRNGTNLLPRFGWVMPWGREGSGKTSILVDLLFHAASGVEWLGYPIERAVRIVAIVNEGIPGAFQDKLRQKLEAWPHDPRPVRENIAVYASPWGEFTFADERMFEHAQSYARDFDADYVALDPLHTLGTTGAGAPADTEMFKHMLRRFGVWEWLGVITAHHSNKLGIVSGDWGRHPDTVMHVEKDGKNPATKLTIEKARPAAPDELGVPMLLAWNVETFGYTRHTIERVEQVDDDVLRERIFETLGKATGDVTMTELRERTPGEARRVGEVAKALIERGDIVNSARTPGRFKMRLPEPGERHERLPLDVLENGLDKPEKPFVDVDEGSEGSLARTEGEPFVRTSPPIGGRGIEPNERIPPGANEDTAPDDDNPFL